MSRTDRMISTSEVHRVINNGELIEDYPEGTRGHSCLILGYGDSERAIHVVCSPKEDYLAIITAYLPDREQWEDNLKKEEKEMKCIYCQGEMVRKTAPFHIDRKGYHLLFDAIPAWVCNQCGEPYFEEAKVDAIQEVSRKIDQETEKLIVAN